MTFRDSPRHCFRRPLAELVAGLLLTLAAAGQAIVPAEGSAPPTSVPAAAPGILRVRITGTDGALLAARAWVENSAHERLFQPTSPPTASPYKPDRSFSCDGSFEMELSPGPIVVHVEKGKEFIPVEQPCTLLSGESKEIVVVLERWVNMAAAGYYSADLHMHFGNDSPAVLRQLSLADDLNLVPSFTYWLRGNEASLPGTWPDWPDGGTLKVDSTHLVTRNNIELERITRRNDPDWAIGAAFLYNLKAVPRVPQFTARYPADAAMVLAAKAASPDSVADTDKTTWAESVVGAALGAYDVAQICHNHYHRLVTMGGGWGMVGALAPGEQSLMEPDELFRRTTTQYYHWLNCGIRMGVSGGSAMGVMPVPAGYSRTYAKIEGALTPEKFWAAVKAGKTFATSGPMLTFEINRQGMGATLRRSPEDHSALDISARLQARDPVDTIQLLENGQVVAEEKALPAGTATTDRAIHWKIVPRRSSWYAVRALYKAPDGRIRLAHTSPIYLLVADKPIAVKASADYLLGWIGHLEELAKAPGRFQNDAERDETLALYARARAVYERAAKSAALDWGD